MTEQRECPKCGGGPGIVTAHDSYPAMVNVRCSDCDFSVSYVDDDNAGTPHEEWNKEILDRQLAITGQLNNVGGEMTEEIIKVFVRGFGFRKRCEFNSKLKNGGGVQTEKESIYMCGYLQALTDLEDEVTDFSLPHWQGQLTPEE